MTKILKITGIVLSTLIILILAGVVTFITFVNPNRFKPLIVEQVQKYTGRQFAMDGDLSWSLFPYLGIKVRHIRLANAPDFGSAPFAEIDGATLGVRILPLLHAQIESSGITLKGLHLTLVKHADGKTNWEDLLPANQNQHVSSQPAKTAALGLAISGIDITDANISLVDEKTKQTLAIKNFDLHAKNINLNNPFPVSAEFILAANQPPKSVHISLQSQVSLNVIKQVYALNQSVLTAKMDNYNLSLKSDVIVNLANGTVQVNNFAGQTANLVMTGKANITHLTETPRLVGYVQIQPFDLKKFLDSTVGHSENVQSAKNVSGNLNFAATLPDKLSANGTFKMDELQTSSLKTTHINGQIHYENGLLRISPLTADFYQGNLHTDAKVNVLSENKDLTLNVKLANVQARPLLKDLKPSMEKFTLTGTLNGDVNLTGTISPALPLTKSLNGNGSVQFTNGTVEGVDLGYLLDSAYALAKRQTLPGNNSNKTAFNSLTGTVVIRNGVMTNNDLKLEAPRLAGEGSGRVDLVNNKIDYSLQASLKKTANDSSDNLKNLFGLPIPVRITGNLVDPNVQLDTSVLAKALAKQQIAKAATKIQEQIQNKLKDKLPGKAGQLLQNLLGQ